MGAPVRQPAVFVPHGGGPWPVLPMAGLDEGERAALLAGLRALFRIDPCPRAVLVVTAHWEADRPTVSAHPRPPMLYDYSGFAPEAYELDWPAPGSPELAARVLARLDEAGIAAASDPERGFDHGTFVPMMVGWPAADVPTVQLSLCRDLDPARHLALGRALAPLRDEGVLIVGSGNSFHNLRALFGPTPQGVQASERFDAWLARVVGQALCERDEQLAGWSTAPHAGFCHPRSEHLLPLLVVAGAAGEDRGRVAWAGRFNGFAISGHRFG